jgi:hypothetical protein
MAIPLPVFQPFDALIRLIATPPKMTARMLPIHRLLH